MVKATYGVGPMQPDWVPPTSVEVHHRVTDSDAVACKRLFDQWYTSWENGHLPQSGAGATDVGWEEIRALLWSRQLTLNQVRGQLKGYKCMKYPSLAQSAARVRLPVPGAAATKTKLAGRAGDLQALADEIIKTLESDATCTQAPTAAWAKVCVTHPALRAGLKDAAVEHCAFLTELLVALHSSKTTTTTA